MTNSVGQSHSDCRLTKFSLMLLQMQISFPKRLPLSRRVLIVNPLKWSSLAESISNSFSLNKFVDYTWAKFRKIRGQSMGYKSGGICAIASLFARKINVKDEFAVNHHHISHGSNPFSCSPLSQVFTTPIETTFSHSEFELIYQTKVQKMRRC